VLEVFGENADVKASIKALLVSVQLMLERLKKRKLLSYANGVIRLSTRTPIMNEKTVDVPLVGSVACGLLSLTEQDPEAVIQVSIKIARPGHTYFLLRASGTSMNKSEINDGDLALVRQQVTANPGEKVVAPIDDSATIKHFHREGVGDFETQLHGQT